MSSIRFNFNAIKLLRFLGLKFNHQIFQVSAKGVQNQLRE